MEDRKRIGQFEILRELGRGGMGKVYLANDTLLDRKVAIKVVSFALVEREQADLEVFSERLVREAKIAASLDHPGIVAVYQVGRVDEKPEKPGKPYIVMQFVDGPDLDSLLTHHSFERRETVRILKEVGFALDYAHEKGVIHRDIKPANIMLAHGQTVKLCDFGIAKSMAPLGKASSVLMGTPNYMAPEQLMYKPLDRRTDQWALGVVAYLMLSGRLPFQGVDNESLAGQICYGSPPPLRELDPTLAPGASEVVARALSKDPRGRFPTCSEFASELAVALRPPFRHPSVTRKIARAQSPTRHHTAKPPQPAESSPESEQADTGKHDTGNDQTVAGDLDGREASKHQSNVIGIDLGTTNSVVALMEGGRSVIVPDRQGGRATPSVVGFTKTGEQTVGQAAKRRAVTDPETTIYSISKLMGRQFNEIDEEMKQSVAYRLVAGANGEACVDILGKKYSPPEISAMILTKLKENAESYLGETVTRVIITVPAGSSHAQRQAINDAAKLAGLEVIRIINAPTAAALAYALNKHRQETIAVYSFGGGAFDISILEVGDGLIEVKSINGDTRFGGDNIDQRLIDWLVEEFKRDQGLDVSRDRVALQRLREAAEQAKIELSTLLETEINLPFLAADATGPKHLAIKLSRMTFEQMVNTILRRSVEPCKQAMRDADVTPEEIDEVVLVGGSTRIPKVQQIVEELFGKEPNKSVNPFEGIAAGGAIQAGILGGEVQNLILLDATPHSLGIKTFDGAFARVIERNTMLPTRKSEVFSTVADKQVSVEIKVYEGERAMARDNRLLHTFRLVGIPPAPRGTPRVEVTFDVDANGSLQVIARDLATDNKQKITIAPSLGLRSNGGDKTARSEESRSNEDHNQSEQLGLVRAG